jgi:hypothetical protein
VLGLVLLQGHPVGALEAQDGLQRCDVGQNPVAAEAGIGRLAFFEDGGVEADGDVVQEDAVIQRAHGDVMG